MIYFSKDFLLIMYKGAGNDLTYIAVGSDLSWDWIKYPDGKDLL